MRNTLMKLGILVLAILTLTGCWNRRELNELMVASALGIDKHDNGYEVTVQLINPAEIAAKQGGGVRAPVIALKASEGKTVFESMRELTATAPRKIYLSHIRILVVGEELARQGIAEILDILSRDHEFRTDFYMMVAKDTTAREVLKILTPLDKIPSNKLFTSLETTEQSWGATARVDLHGVIFDLVSKGKDPALSAIRVIGNADTGESMANLNFVQPPAIQQYNGVAVFREDALAGWFNTAESKGYNYILGNIRSTIESVACPNGGYAGMEVIRTQHKVKGAVENGRPAIHVSLRVEGNISEIACGIDLGNPRTVTWLETKVSGQIKDKMESAVKKAKTYRADVFGFGNALHRANPDFWRSIEQNWMDYFVDLPVQLEVKAELRRTGSVVESFIEKWKE
ncbi:spore germination protein KC [Paenibacillus sp. UNCCL117]|uniref:Ger(x)C family spore germination protein n=1 Tax=unclassified Paenibacillus TaxID=185978 RepID=UPI00088556E9|nr:MULTISPECIES: Ger(x)C family spore germination protein [unclassified Paenibacillus]SDD39190.1 spore germination protein KC [Paenibacillus sp. cl123]SFW48420.1 spore germination protein KC [Paenibacillus sp. UNCCL117]